MDTQIIEKLQLAQMIINILNETKGRDNKFISSCVSQLLEVKNSLETDVRQAKDEAQQYQYMHIANIIDNCKHTITKYAYEEDR